MRILTWNINGVRTIPQYHPWNTLESHDAILDKLEADIICFQEMKSSRQTLPKSVALPPSYDSFFSFPLKKSGYSGVATYTRIATVTPVKAEEGITGLIQPKPPFTPEERVSRYENYPPQLMYNDELDYKHLDSEGRAVTVDFGLFVLINVYCPNDGTGTDERDKYKMDYHRVLSERVRGLQEEGREVIVLGDINACAAVIDHCEGNIMVARGKAAGMEDEDGFWERECRRWLRDWLQTKDGTGGPLIDIVRRFWPGRKGMYTCWNTKISARETNYGTRIDYILITPGLLPWIKAADVQQDVKGSDHCPVFVDFHDEITGQDGQVIKLRDVLGIKANSGGKKEPPRLAAKFWEEHSGKQTSLRSFFGKNKTVDQAAIASPTYQLSAPDQRNKPEARIEPDSLTLSPSSHEHTPPISQTPSLSVELPTPSPTQTSSDVSTVPQPLKRKITVEKYSSQSASKKAKPSEKKTDKKGKNDPGQAKLSSFFNKPNTPQSSSSSTLNKSSTSSQILEESIIDEDTFILYDAPVSSQASSTGTANGDEIKQVWNNLLAPVQPPNCIIHGEPAKEFTVNKPGPNKGKKFFICSRPVGPGWDRGKAERLREEVDLTYRCNFFRWSSDWRKQAKQMESRASISSAKHGR
ncbi:hypothetical protein D9756_002784 [Leucocoprinus leucothites]|uniref:DNA-(apurinic or apyrimidinic site) endonuclease n=1 Tax=Leucocoprinus leucothites TaxID=201217 RepID=A0A8H5LLX4_9AGAR|nr:hypothetical protein D9756_002784 [Leucoagaricus leucothites]